MEICYTISLCISEIDAEVSDYKQWLEQADQALYAAKKSGRNQAIVYQSQSEPILNITANNEKQSTG